MKETLKYYHWLLLTAFLLFCLSLICSSYTFDIHFHDTYYVFSSNYLILFICILLFGIWLLYKAIHFRLFSKKLGYIHTALTIISVLVLLICLFIVQESIVKLKPGTFEEWEKMSELSTLNQIAAGSVLLFVFSQILVILNLLIGLFTKKSDLLP